jgi:hypothetical protein
MKKLKDAWFEASLGMVKWCSLLLMWLSFVIVFANPELFMLDVLPEGQVFVESDRETVEVWALGRGMVDLPVVTQGFAENYVPPIQTWEFLGLGALYFVASLLEKGVVESRKTARRRMDRFWSWLMQ